MTNDPVGAISVHGVRPVWPDGGAFSNGERHPGAQLLGLPSSSVGSCRLLDGLGLPGHPGPEGE